MTETTFRTRAWSCDVRLVVAHARALPGAAAELTDLLADVDTIASRFRNDSDLMRANRTAGTPTFISRELTELIRTALHAAAVTDGAVDPTVLPALLGAGYDRDIDEIRDRDVPGRPHGVSKHDWRSVSLNDDLGLLRMPSDVRLDLGATAKAFTADAAARTLAARYGTTVLVEIGGDIALVAPDELAEGWVVAVDEIPSGSQADLLALRRGGIATSTTVRRRWSVDGATRHHIIDPATGTPVDGPWRSVSVIAESCLEANTASTAAIVKGIDALAWLTEAGYAARLVDQDGAIVTTATWPTHTEDLVSA